MYDPPLLPSLPTTRVTSNEGSGPLRLPTHPDGVNTSSPSSTPIFAPPPSPVHSASPASPSPFTPSSPPTFFSTTVPRSTASSTPISTASSPSTTPSTSLRSSPLLKPTPSPSHIPPLLPLLYDEDAKSSPHDRGDGPAWQDDSDKGFHPREAKDGDKDEKDAVVSSPLKVDVKAPSLPLPSVRDAERVAKAAEKEAVLSAERAKACAEEEKYSADQHKLLHLLTSMFRCRECMPTWKDREEQRLGIETNEYSSRRLGEYCCIGHALSSSFPASLPLDLLPLTQGYLLHQPTRSFLTHPPPVSAGVIQCYILKTNNKFELFMEMRDQGEWQSIRKRMIERGHLHDPSNPSSAPSCEKSTNSRSSRGSSYSSASFPSSSAASADKERERSELLERLFRDRQAWRLMMKGNAKGPSSPANSGQGKGSNTNLGLEERMKENNQKSMLLQHAEGLLQKNEDIFLLAAQRKRAWTGNSYTISMDRENAKAEGGSREFIGKLKSNFGGTEFVMFDCGVKASKKGGKKADKADAGNGSVTPLTPNSRDAAASAGATRYQRECGVIQYDHFFEHTGSPIRIKILLPNRSFYPLDTSALSGAVMKQYKMESKEGQQTATASQPMAQVAAEEEEEEGGVVAPGGSTPTSTTTAASSARVKAAMDVDEYEYQTVGQHVEVFENLRPVWHDGMNAYVLHFDNHRVREKSVKNFKLVRVNDGEKKTVLQFGRVMDRNVFVMDFAWPLSAFQAFSICLSKPTHASTLTPLFSSSHHPSIAH